MPLLGCGGGSRFCLPLSEAQNLAFSSGLGKIWNKSGEEGEHIGCVLQVGEKMNVSWALRWSVKGSSRKKRM